jgi:nucleotide-binding universal stress UspA family protein
MIALKTILVATDFSEPSEVAVRYGRALAEAFHASLHIIHGTGHHRPGSVSAAVP